MSPLDLVTSMSSNTPNNLPGFKYKIGDRVRTSKSIQSKIGIIKMRYAADHMSPNAYLVDFHGLEVFYDEMHLFPLDSDEKEMMESYVYVPLIKTCTCGSHKTYGMDCQTHMEWCDLWTLSSHASE